VRNTTKDIEVTVTVVAKIVIVETMKREDKQTNKISVDKDAVMEDVIILIVQMLNVTIVENIGITQGGLLCQEDSGRRCNLVEEDEGILVMTNKDITIDSDMVWYIDTGASNHICGHIHLFVDIQEIEDGHVSFGDSTKVPIKGKGKTCFSQTDGKIVLWRMSIMYLT